MSRKTTLEGSIRFTLAQALRHEADALNAKRRAGRLLAELRQVAPRANAGLPADQIALLLALGRARRG
jgi:hypothetical protein